MKTRIVVGAIIWKGERMMLGRKSKGVGPYPNTWMILGGGVDLEKETIEEAIIREIKEEGNIEIKNINAVNFDDDYEPDKNGQLTHYLFLQYSVDYKAGQEKPGDDITELKWFDKEELKTIPFARPSIKLFKKLKLI